MSDVNEFDSDSGALAFALADDETTPGDSEAALQPEAADAPVPEGTVRVAVRRGHKFVLPNPEGEDLVVTDKEPVRVPETVVEALIKASNGRLFVVPETEEG